MLIQLTPPASLARLGLAAFCALATVAPPASAGIGLNRSASYAVFLTSHAGQSPMEVAQSLELQHFDKAFPAPRMHKLLNRMSAEQLQREHRLWRLRAADPSYAVPGEARDQLAMLEIALEARDVPPLP